MISDRAKVDRCLLRNDETGLKETDAVLEMMSDRAFLSRQMLYLEMISHRAESRTDVS